LPADTDHPIPGRLSFHDWMEQVTGPEWTWYVKRLSANDTLANHSHQVGPYVPKPVFFDLFPSTKSGGSNPDAMFTCSIDSPAAPERTLRAIWYNQKTRNECRITRWGGGDSPILDPDSTGSVCVFAFHQQAGHDADHCRIWLCDLFEEGTLQDRTGPVEPGIPLVMEGGLTRAHAELIVEARSCWLSEAELPADWLREFPSARDIVAKAVELRPLRGEPADTRLLSRRDCEFAVFRSLENVVVLPQLKQGFDSVDEFIAYGHSIANRRKSRSGWSLEYQLAEIFTEERVAFSHGETSEGHKKPDFLFPSAEAYRKKQQPLAMLAAKTTCKDRWRQILNEADLIPEKHLLTVQEGLSENQFKEMQDAGVKLVVPRKLQDRYPKPIRRHLLSLDDFLGEVRPPPD